MAAYYSRPSVCPKGEGYQKVAEENWEEEKGERGCSAGHRRVKLKLMVSGAWGVWLLVGLLNIRSDWLAMYGYGLSGKIRIDFQMGWIPRKLLRIKNFISIYIRTARFDIDLKKKKNENENIG
jgi:hypothetical protein